MAFANLLSPFQSNFEDAAGDLVASFTIDANSTLTRGTAQASEGSASGKLNADVVGPVQRGTKSGVNAIPATPSTAYTHVMYVRSSVPAGVSVSVAAQYFTSAGTIIGASSTTTTQTVDNTGFVAFTVHSTSPSNAAFTNIRLSWTSTVVNQVTWFDQLGISLGTWSAADWVVGGGAAPSANITLSAGAVVTTWSAASTSKGFLTPSANADDVLVAFCAYEINSTTTDLANTPPAGWTSAGNIYDLSGTASNSVHLTVATKTAVGGVENPTWTFASPGAFTGIITVIAYNNVDAGTPWDQSTFGTEATSVTTHTMPSVTPAISGAWSIIAGTDGSGNAFTLPTGQGLTLRDSSQAVSAGTNLIVADSNGSVPTGTATSYTVTSPSATAAMAEFTGTLRPASVAASIATPTTVGGSRSFTAPTVRADVTLSVTAPSGARNITTPLVIVTTNTILTPVSLGCGASTPTAPISAGATVSASVVGSSATFGTAVVSIGYTASAGIAAGTRSITAPVASAGVTVAAPAASRSAFFAVPGITAGTTVNANVSPAAVSGAASIPTAAPNASIVLAAVSVNSAATVPQGIAAISSLASPAAVDRAGTFAVPAISAGIIRSPASVVATGSILRPDIISGSQVAINASVVDRAVSIPQLVGITSVALSPDVVAGTRSIATPTVTVQMDVIVSATSVAAVRSITAPVVVSYSNPSPGATFSATAFTAPIVNNGIGIIAPVVSSTATVPNGIAQTSTNQIVQAISVDAVGTVGTSTPSADITLPAAAVTSSQSFTTPSISVGQTIAPDSQLAAFSSTTAAIKVGTVFVVGSVPALLVISAPLSIVTSGASFGVKTPTQALILNGRPYNAVVPDLTGKVAVVYLGDSKANVATVGAAKALVSTAAAPPGDGLTQEAYGANFYGAGLYG